MSAISISGLKKAFHGHSVLRGIDLEIERGQLICLIGRSGCGKSTLLRCLNGLEALDEGRVQIGEHVLTPGRDFSRASKAVRRQVGFVFQQFQLFPHLTLLENVAMAPQIVQQVKREEARSRAGALLERVGLKAHAHKHPVQLSGGQQQRGAIARALALSPKVMLYDEPTSALDPELVDEVLQVMRTLDREEDITQVVVTHEMRFAREAADHIVFLDDGLIVEHAPPQELFTRPRDDRTRQFLRKFL